MKTQMQDLPQPKTKLIELATSIFTPVKNHLCITCFFISGTGKRTLIKLLIEKKEILRQVFQKDFDKTIFIYIDPDEVLDVSNEAYLRLILDRIIEKMQKVEIKSIYTEKINPIYLIKQNLEKLLSKDFHIVILLNDFEYTLSLSPTIYRNLESILALDKARISYVFLSTINFLDENILSKLHNFKYAINRVVYYYPLLDNQTTDFLIDEVSLKIKIKIDPKIRTLLKELCGGHAQLLKYSINILQSAGSLYLNSVDDAEQYLLYYEQLKTICNDIWNYFNTDEKDILVNVVKTGLIPEALSTKADFLTQSHVIFKSKNNKYQIFGRLFAKSIFNRIPQAQLVFDAESNQIYYGTAKCTGKFTFQEFKLLSYFITNENKIISRDEVAQTLWGKKYIEQYSDWSIDKIISTIRKKLDLIGFPSQNLTTLKKRGFSLTNS